MLQHKQTVAQALSARVNEAYQGLLRPLARAEYILSRNDLPVSEHDQVDDTAFMVQTMESRELIDDAEESSEVISLMEANDGKLGVASCLARLNNFTRKNQRDSLSIGEAGWQEGLG